MEGQKRLLMITDAKYLEDTLEFLEDNPEFLPYTYLTSLTKKPYGYGFNKGETIDEYTPITFNDFILYYSCNAGVRAEYGDWLWKRVKGKTNPKV